MRVKLMMGTFESYWALFVSFSFEGSNIKVILRRIVHETFKIFSWVRFIAKKHRNSLTKVVFTLIISRQQLLYEQLRFMHYVCLKGRKICFQQDFISVGWGSDGAISRLTVARYLDSAILRSLVIQVSAT